MGSTKKPSSSVLEAWSARWGPRYLSFHSPPTVTGFYVVWRFKVQGQKTCFEEHTEYVALEVNLSKSGWPTMYETL